MRFVKAMIANLKRIWLEVLLLASIGLVLLYMPEKYFPISEIDRVFFMGLFLNKLVFVSAGILHAHISRKILFPYLNLQNERRAFNVLFVAAWYLIIIFSWARGG